MSLSKAHFGSAHVTDLLLDSKGNIIKFTNPRLEIKEVHGSGCNFSSAVTAYLAKGMSLQRHAKWQTNTSMLPLEMQ